MMNKLIVLKQLLPVQLILYYGTALHFILVAAVQIIFDVMLVYSTE